MSILDNIELLSTLNEKEKENLSMFCQEKQVLAGEVLFHENDNTTAVYLLKTGHIEVTRENQGSKIILGEVHSEEILGEMSIFSVDHRRMATATAIENCQIVVILGFSIEELTKTHPELLEKIKLIIHDRIISNKKR